MRSFDVTLKATAKGTMFAEFLAGPGTSVSKQKPNFLPIQESSKAAHQKIGNLLASNKCVRLNKETNDPNLVNGLLFLVHWLVLVLDLDAGSDPLSGVFAFLFLLVLR